MGLQIILFSLGLACDFEYWTLEPFSFFFFPFFFPVPLHDYCGAAEYVQTMLFTQLTDYPLGETSRHQVHSVSLAK